MQKCQAAHKAARFLMSAINHHFDLSLVYTPCIPLSPCNIIVHDIAKSSIQLYSFVCLREVFYILFHGRMKEQPQWKTAQHFFSRVNLCFSCWYDRKSNKNNEFLLSTSNTTYVHIIKIYILLLYVDFIWWY